MMRKCSIIEDVLFSNKNKIAVEVELAQFNDLFKMFLSIHEEYSQVLDNDERVDEDDWFNDLDNAVCTFKRKIHSWLRSAETERKSSKGSSRSSESRRNKSSGSSRKSQFSRARELEEKARTAELMAEAEYIKQRQLSKNQAEMLKIQQEIAKSKARAEVYGKDDTKSIDGRSQLSDDKIDLDERCQPRNIAHSTLHHHRSNALRKDDDAIYGIGHDRGQMRTQRVKGQQHENNLRRNNDANVAEMMCKLVNQQSAPEIYIDVFGGNPFEFHYFMAVFDEAVEKKY